MSADSGYLLTIRIRYRMESRESSTESLSRSGSGTHITYLELYLFVVCIDSVHVSKSTINGYAHKSYGSVSEKMSLRYIYIKVIKIIHV